MYRRLFLLAAILFVACGDRQEESNAPPDGGRVDADAGVDLGSSWQAVHELPLLQDSEPPRGATNVPRTTWLVLSFQQSPGTVVGEDFRLECDDSAIPVTPTLLDDDRLVVNPDALLPGAANCRLEWFGPGSEIAELEFGTAARGEKAAVVFDRTDTSILPPFPDDTLSETDDTTRTGKRVAFPSFDDMPPSVRTLTETLTQKLDVDGFSPLAPLVVQLTDAPDETTLPVTVEDSLRPLSTVALFRINGPTSAERVPFTLWVRSDTNADGSESHVLLVWPASPLEQTDRYALVVTNRALVTPERPLEASEFFAAALTGDDSEQAARVGELAVGVLETLEASGSPIRSDDVALVTRFTIRSTDSIFDAHLAVREHIDTMNVPTFRVDEVIPENDPDSAVAAIVTGTWQQPDYVDGSGWYLRRDDDGLPVAEGTRDAPFVVALPDAALDGPVPIVMFQHGMPGDAETQVPCEARTHLAAAGFAVAGFTNYVNRAFEGGLEELLQGVLQQLFATRRFPDIMGGPLTLAEQLAFVRLLKEELAQQDLLPVDAPDGVVEMDADSLLYLGQSDGSTVGISLVAHEPAIVAANLNVAGGRHSAIWVHQGTDVALYEALTEGLFEELTWSTLQALIVTLQMWTDPVDSALFARRVYLDPIDLDGSKDRASILMSEGIGDILVPPESTTVAARTMGIPLIEPAYRHPALMETIGGPVQANIGSATTAGLVQFDPANRDGPIAQCPDQPVDPDDGHQYAQDNDRARALRIEFFESAMSDDAPRILESLDP